VALGRTEFHQDSVALTVMPPSDAGVMSTLMVPVSGPESATFVFQPNLYWRWRGDTADGDAAGVASGDPNNTANNKSINRFAFTGWSVTSKLRSFGSISFGLAAGSALAKSATPFGSSG
jgi:hypothetical protein